MKSQDSTSICFVNYVIGRGILHGVINLSFGAFNFSPSDNDAMIDADPVVVCRLRMDKACFSQLRDAINTLHEQIEAEEKSAHLAAQIEAAAEVEGIMPSKRVKIN